MKNKIEICEICQEPTGNSESSNDSIQCAVCCKIICEKCGEQRVNKMDGDTYWICNICEKESE